MSENETKRDKRHNAEDILREALRRNAISHTGPMVGWKCTKACVRCEAIKLVGDPTKGSGSG
jgi:hypothetical protein